jgi:hypothetical protein
MMARRVRLKGVVRGRSIDLDGDIGIPDSTRVQVSVEVAATSTLEEKRAIVDKVAGVWADDPSIEAIFKEIEAERRQSRPRPIDFDLDPRR